MSFAPRLTPDPALLERLLRTGQLRRSPAPGGGGQGGLDSRGRRALSTGVASLDAALGGGFARGELHEIVAPPSAGGTALLRAALAAATRAGELCGLVDLADAFDPRGAAQMGLELRRLLWVRPSSPAQALRACELLLEADFALVALDLGDLPPARAPQTPPGPRAPLTGHVELVRFEPRRKGDRPGPSPWARLGRRAEKHQGALVVLSRAPQLGSFAAATLELARVAPRWEGQPGTPGRLLRGASAVGAVARARRRAPSGPWPLQLPLPEEEASGPP